MNPRQASLELGGTITSHLYHLKWYLCLGYNGRPNATSNVAHLKPKEVLCLKCRIEASRKTEESKFTAQSKQRR
ncbi:hypothetical protein B296_00054081 [Ensete ventricosum]|uniref:Uncharacterized protein n=1 Tax=Ensete ventricosum TaxID=4639 RepID=A0A426WVD2_ENSVE|nr:hypothetical protein B296_00054081 [Ensete ventricosum]